jgi:hypothetical protein
MTYSAVATNEGEGLDMEQLIIGGTDVITRPQTFASGANVLALTVMGRVTATGKLIKSVATASDGSQVPVAIAVEYVPSASADKIAPTYVAGEFNVWQLVWDESWSGQELTAFIDKPIVLKELPALAGYFFTGTVDPGYTT